MEEEKKSVFRVQGKNFFITYPRCDISPAVMLAELKTHFKHMVYGKVVREKHSDEGYHLHALVQSESRVDIKNQAFLDYRGFHPNIQRCRDPSAVFHYTEKEKEDPEFAIAEEGKFISPETKKIQKQLEKNKLILSQPLWKLAEEGRISVIQLPLCRKAKDLYFMEKKLDQMKVKLDLPPALVYEFGPKDTPRIMEFKINLKEKQCHLWVFSPPNYGKTSFAKELTEKFKAEFFNLALNNPQISPDTQIYIIDEVKPKTKPASSFLNQLCDGTQYINAKFHGFTMEKKALIVVLSNHTIEEVYDDPVEQDTTQARFCFVDLEECRFRPGSMGNVKPLKKMMRL